MNPRLAANAQASGRNKNLDCCRSDGSAAWIYGTQRDGADGTSRATLADLEALDAHELKALIVAQHQQLATQEERILTQNEQLASRDAEIEHLKLLIAKLRRMQFGRSSEKLDRQIEQLELRLVELEEVEARIAGARNIGGGKCGRPARRPLPEGSTA